MATPTPDSSLLARYEAEWARLNPEEAEQLRANSRALSPVQRLELGQMLSRQVFSLLVASIDAGELSRQVLCSEDRPDLKRLMARKARARGMCALLEDAAPHGGNAAEVVKASRPSL